MARNDRRYTRPPATLGGAARAHLSLIAWCKACGHEVKFGAESVAELASRYGLGVSLDNWQRRLVCSSCGGRDIDSVVSGSGKMGVGA